MRRTPLSTALLLGSLCVLLVVLFSGSRLGASVARAQSDPPPRPTLTPAPTAKPASSSNPSSAAATGRITGTVIDLTTGAPAPGVAVTVGDTTVTTDANGNYERNGLPADNYAVALALTASQGMAAQGVVMVTLAEGATVIQHLSFRSPQPAAPTPRPIVMPAALPQTGAPSDGAWLVLVGLGILALGLGLRFGRPAAR